MIKLIRLENNKKKIICCVLFSAWLSYINKYDANGLRTQKTVNGVVYNYGYENGKLVYERKGDEYEVIYRYDADGNLFTVNRCILSSGYTSLLYAVNNTRGDVVALYKGGGGIYSTYTYDSWGKPIVEATEMSAENSIRYRGYVYDQETGLYYLQSRYYDPETGRFLNADDVDFIGYSGEDIFYNAFAYCENNAVNLNDITGQASGKNSLSKLFGQIFAIILILELIKTVEEYTYYTNTYTKGEVHIVDPKIEEYVDSTQKNIYVVDYRNEKDPNMRILSSYKIKNKKYQKEVADILLDYNSMHPVTPSWKRIKDSIVAEWNFHNMAYYMNYKRSRTADTDLNNKDEGKSFFDFVGR